MYCTICLENKDSLLPGPPTAGSGPKQGRAGKAERKEIILSTSEQE